MNVYFLSISVGCFLQIKDPIRCGDMSPSPRSFYSTFRSKASCAFGYWVHLNSISVGRKSPIVTVLPFATTPLQIGHGSGGGFGEGQTCGRDATRNGAHDRRLGDGDGNFAITKSCNHPSNRLRCKETLKTWVDYRGCSSKVVLKKIPWTLGFQKSRLFSKTFVD